MWVFSIGNASEIMSIFKGLTIGLESANFSGGCIMEAKTITFNRFPLNVNDTRMMFEQIKKDPFYVAALSVAVFCHYKQNRDETFNMIDVLKGPQPLSNFDKQFLRDRLGGKEYKPFSFFEGAYPENEYVPTQPYRITVEKGMYQSSDPNYVTMYLRSNGADAPRSLILRAKGGVDWYLTEITYLGDIKVPVSQDPWA